MRTTTRRSALAAGSLVATSAMVATALMAGPAGAAATLSVSPTSGPIGTVIKVSGTCNGDIGGAEWGAVGISLFFSDAFTYPNELKSSIVTASATPHATTGKFSGTVTVPATGKYTRRGPTPATPGPERTVRVTGRLGVQVSCLAPGISSSPVDVATLTNIFRVDKAKQKFTVSKKPTIKGKAKVGKKLKAKVGTWSPEPTSFAYQWKRGKKDIAGATKKKYKVKAKDAGKKLRVVVTGQRDNVQTLSVKSKKKKVAATKKVAKVKKSRAMQKRDERRAERRERARGGR